MNLIARCLVVLVLGLSAGPGCSRSSQASGLAAEKPKAVDAGNPQTVVVRIAFLDQEKCCDCTRRRIEASWAALQAALGSKSDVKVERVHVDTQKSQAEAYRRLKPNQVIPALYFLDHEGQLVEMLQGEVSADAVRKALR